MPLLESIASAEEPVPDPDVLPEFMLLVEPLVPVEFIEPEPDVPVEFIVPEPEVPDVPVPVVVVALLVPVPVVPARVFESAAWTAAKILAMEKAAAAVVMTAFDNFMMIS